MWKSQLRNVSAKTIPTMRTNLKKVPKKPEGNNCNKKLEEMANKLSNYNLLLKERWEAGWPAFQEYYKPLQKIKEYDLFILTIKDEYNWLVDNWDLHEGKSSLYNSIPEDVACEALRILETHEQTQKEYDTAKQYEFEGWRISRDFNFDYQRNINSLLIQDPQGDIKVHLSWSNGEDNGLIRKPGSSDTVDTNFGEHNIYRLSGYYDAREFGFSWHE